MISPLTFLSILIVSCSAQWSQATSYTSSTCSGTPFSYSVGSAVGCTPSACTPFSGTYATITCPTSVPSIPAGYYGWIQHGGTCSAPNPAGVSWYPIGCTFTGGSTSNNVSCSNNILTVSAYSASTTCSGTSTSYTVANTCVSTSYQVSNCPFVGTTTTSTTKVPGTGTLIQIAIPALILLIVL